MNKNVEKILNAAASHIVDLKVCISYNGDEAAKNLWRGNIRGLLEAAKLLTGNTYDWDEKGIYENGSNEPIVKC